MIDVSEKLPTKRRAVAEGRIEMALSTLEKILNKAIPKGDVLAMAEVSGIMAAKKVSDILPLCHPLSLDAVRVYTEPDHVRPGIVVRCEAIAFAKTGVEMEALTGVSAALLAIYDLVKGVDPVLRLSDIYVKTKEGGKSTIAKQSVTLPLDGTLAGVLTISDRCFRGERDDQSGLDVEKTLKSWGARVLKPQVVPDEIESIQTAVRRLVYDQKCEIVITTGGTGLSPRDVTPEALRKCFTKEVQGLGEYLRLSGSQKTPFSWLSRSVVGLMDDCLILALPGSQKAVREGLDAVESLLPHVFHILKGGDHVSERVVP